MAQVANTGSDIFLCHVKKDEPFVNFISGKIQEHGLSIWRNDLARGKEKGVALLEAKAILVVLSLDSNASKPLNDEVALAYISDKPIFPVTMHDYKSMEKFLDFSMKLIVAKLNWSFFPMDNNGSYNEDYLPVLVKSIIRVLSHNATESQSPRSSAVEVPCSLIRELGCSGPRDVSPSAHRIFNRWRERVRKSITENGKVIPDFWEKTFDSKTEVPWTEFRAAFLNTYREKILMQMPEDKVSWITNLIYGEILELKKIFSKNVYVTFCGGSSKCEGDPNRFYHQVMDYARGKIAMKEIFNMDSTVRLIAINNLGQFQTSSVVSVLISLLTDQDANIRTVAAIAIGKTGTKNPRVIKKLMDKVKDDDRMVREASCLSLGHLKSAEAIPLLVDIWRNDIISNVRNAALTALRIMDSPDAQDAIRVTKLLDEEVDKLKISMILRH